MKRWFYACVAMIMAGLVAAPVLADPPEMDAVVFPVDTDSVVTSIATAGGTILLLVFSVAIGFYLIKKLYNRVRHAI